MSAVGDARKRAEEGFADNLADGVEEYRATPEDSAHRSLDRALDVEALAAVLFAADKEGAGSPRGFGATLAKDPCAFAYRAQARAVLASDWLAQLLIQARDEGYERGLDEGRGDLDHWQRRARAEALMEAADALLATRRDAAQFDYGRWFNAGAAWLTARAEAVAEQGGGTDA